MAVNGTTAAKKKSFWDRLPFPFGERSWWVDGTTHLLEIYEDEPELWRAAVISEFDHHGFDYQVFIVAALGFLTDSYALFATNIILPSMAFIYWPQEIRGDRELAINAVTILGSIIGQLLFGFLADKLGRRKLYGLELVTVIFGTLGMAQASSGVNGNMSILGWIIFWRFVLGIGIGAEYPLSSVITAEFADKKARAKMMAFVFMMQPLGQILAASIGWGVLTSIMKSRDLQNVTTADASNDQDLRSAVDVIWRTVIGVGAFPALLATLWRFSIPESPRYTMDVDRDVQRALADIRRHHKDKDLKPPTQNQSGETTSPVNTENVGNSTAVNNVKNQPKKRINGTTTEEPITNPVPPKAPKNNSPERSFYTYLFLEKNWRYLVATSMCWFLLDFAFYGLGISSPRQLGQIWDDTSPKSSTVPYWENPFNSHTTLYWQLFDSAKEYVYTICFGSLTGSILLYFTIDYIPRKGFLVISFIVLSVLFVITAILVKFADFTHGHWATVVFYALCQFFFNFGPNTLTFIIPAEIFPTEFRCRCHGISAASGKLGAITVQIILWKLHSQHLSLALGLFSIPMALGALFAWVWLPELQEGPDPGFVPSPFLFFFRTFPILPSKGLETLAKGFEYATSTDMGIDPTTSEPRGEGQRLGFRKKVPAAWDRVWTLVAKGGWSTGHNGGGSDASSEELAQVVVSPNSGMPSGHGFSGAQPQNP